MANLKITISICLICILCISCSKKNGPVIEDDFKADSFLTFQVKNVTFQMNYVKGGTFVMSTMKKNEHNVTLSDYFIGETEVTQELWIAVMDTNPSEHVGENLPVDNISWDDCQIFIKKINDITGRTFSLPTEAQWEFAARGGVKSKGFEYAGSNDIDEVAWYNYISGGKTHPVATKKPNELGIYDMSGNVREWCEDWFGEYTTEPQTDPTGAQTGYNKVVRCGSYFDDDYGCKINRRLSEMPVERYHWKGMRLALRP